MSFSVINRLQKSIPELTEDLEEAVARLDRYEAELNPGDIVEAGAIAIAREEVNLARKALDEANDRKARLESRKEEAKAQLDIMQTRLANATWNVDNNPSPLATQVHAIAVTNFQQASSDLKSVDLSLQWLEGGMSPQEMDATLREIEDHEAFDIWADTVDPWEEDKEAAIEAEHSDAAHYEMREG